ncbi:MAG: single-stranded DNA-binding protein [Patescibacteria group bacterium]
MNLNKVYLIGRLTADPQLKAIPSGQSVATFAIATNRVWVNKAGQKQEDVQFHNVVVWGRQAEIVNQFLKKGSLAMIEGRLQNRSWQDKQGQNRRTTEILCEKVQFGPRSQGAGGFEPKNNSNNDAQGTDTPVKEELPEINLDEGEINSENIPF